MPGIDELPPPPPGRVGWPWTEGCPSTAIRRGPLPAVTIVTPSFNQAPFIEETIRSVLLQGYPELEYIVIDGGSTDGTVEIIRKYEPWLAHWESEPDRGQSHAINKGFARATGEILAWLNSDDTYLPDAVSNAARALTARPRVGLVYAGARVVGEGGECLWDWHPPRFSFRTALQADYIPQPSAFFRASTLGDAGALDEAFQFAMDYDLWLRMALGTRVARCRGVWSAYRCHSLAKTHIHKQTWGEDLVRIGTKLLQDRACQTKRALVREMLARSHWFASMAWWRSGDVERARHHMSEGLNILPRFPGTPLFFNYIYAVMFPREHALQVAVVDDELRQHVTRYLELLPATVPARRRALKLMPTFLNTVEAAQPMNSVGDRCRSLLRAFRGSPGFVLAIGAAKWRVALRQLRSLTNVRRAA